MQMRAFLIGVAAAAFATTWTSEANAEWYRACIGQYANYCRAGYNYWFPCGTSVQAAGNRACVIYTPRGPVYRPFSTVTVSSVGGHRCGYLTIDIFCHWRPFR
jgi:hypothetical protein